MVEVEVDGELLLEWLDKMEGRQLFPKLKEGDRITNVKVAYGDRIIFEIGEEE